MITSKHVINLSHTLASIEQELLDDAEVARQAHKSLTQLQCEHAVMSIRSAGAELLSELARLTQWTAGPQTAEAPKGKGKV